MDSRRPILLLPWPEVEEQQTGKGTARGDAGAVCRGRWFGKEERAAPCRGTRASAQPGKLRVQPWLTTGLGRCSGSPGGAVCWVARGALPGQSGDSPLGRAQSILLRNTEICDIL